MNGDRYQGNASTTPPLLTGFDVDDLYGRHTYKVRAATTNNAPSHLILLHGDNGSGKTTLLRLLWHALSPADNRNHRSTLAQIPFRSMSIHFTDGSRIGIVKKDGLTGTFTYTISGGSRGEIATLFETDSSGAVASPASSSYYSALEATLSIGTPAEIRRARANRERRQQVIQFLIDLNAQPQFLADDRRVYVDDPDLDRLRERYTTDPAARLAARDPASNAIVSDELQITLTRVNDWLRTLALRGQSVGSAGSNTIYGNVLRQLAETGLADIEADAGSQSATSRLLADLKVRSPRFERYDLESQFRAEEFQALLASILQPDRARLAEQILVPYLESLNARFNALEEAEQRASALLTATNDFLTGKHLEFSAQSQEGLRIVTDDGLTLGPRQLSSGERQLLMLVCTTLLAGRDSRILLIDEPELSLGSTWQRRILGSILSLSAGSPLQFIVATHSIEVLSTQLDSLVQLT